MTSFSENRVPVSPGIAASFLLCQTSWPSASSAKLLASGASKREARAEAHKIHKVRIIADSFPRLAIDALSLRAFYLGSGVKYSHSGRVTRGSVDARCIRSD